MLIRSRQSFLIFLLLIPAYFAALPSIHSQEAVNELMLIPHYSIALNSSAFDVAWSSDGNTFTIAYIGSLDTPKETWTIAPPLVASSMPKPFLGRTMPINGLPNNQYIVYCEQENQLMFYDTPADENIAAISAPSGDPMPCPINDLAWSPQNLIAIAEDDGQVSIWEIGSILPDSP